MQTKKNAKPAKMKRKDYERELDKLHYELVKLQHWIKDQGLRVVIVFEGRDTAGKGGTIKRITEPLNPRGARVVALGTPSDRERTQWYFQRYVTHLPAAGEIVIFDRSWYNRSGVERVMGFCSEEEYWEFLHSCPEFERMLVRSGIILLKYWLSVSEEEQESRFQERARNPLKHWKLSDIDLKSRDMWVEYSKAKDEAFFYTDIPGSALCTRSKPTNKPPGASQLHRAHLSQLPYEDVMPKKIKLPPAPPHGEYPAPAAQQVALWSMRSTEKAVLRPARVKW